MGVTHWNDSVAKEMEILCTEKGNEIYSGITVMPCRWSLHVLEAAYPAGIWCKNDVGSTSMRRHHVASTLIRRHFCTKCPLGSLQRSYSVAKQMVCLNCNVAGIAISTERGYLETHLLFRCMVALNWIYNVVNQLKQPVLKR